MKFTLELGLEFDFRGIGFLRHAGCPINSRARLAGRHGHCFVGLQRAITDLGERARAKKLVPDEVQGGTITITNPGIFGPQFGTPIILQPQVAILGMGGIFKEPVVITDDYGNDSIAIRHIIRLTLGYDHRIIDGAEADQFMVAVRDYLEKFDEDIG